MSEQWMDNTGKIHNLNTISHDHLSNIYHYIRVINPFSYGNNLKDRIDKLLKDRFDGEVLPYVPKMRSEFETLLHDENAFKPNVNGSIDIFFENKVIGNVSREIFDYMTK